MIKLEYNLSNNLVRQERELNINTFKKIKSYKKNIQNSKNYIKQNENKIDSLNNLLTENENSDYKNILKINMIKNQIDNLVQEK